MPCDISNNLYLQQYNEVLSYISTNIQYNNVNHCIDAGDLNTDFTCLILILVILSVYLQSLIMKIFILYYKIINTILSRHIQA